MAPNAPLRALVIVPTYNEIENLASLVEAVFAQPADLSMLIVDDNSPDGTGKLADDLAAAYPARLSVLHRPGKNGIGPAYVAGFRRALQDDVDMIVTMDADLSHDPNDLPRMLQAAVSADVVIGSELRWSRALGMIPKRSALVVCRALAGAARVQAGGGERMRREGG